MVSAEPYQAGSNIISWTPSSASDYLLGNEYKTKILTLEVSQNKFSNDTPYLCVDILV
ncbi:MAG: hypothetical protein ACJAX5_002284 [Patiriisocius sp.]|jgi:hypothetical protein